MKHLLVAALLGLIGAAVRGAPVEDPVKAAIVGLVKKEFDEKGKEAIENYKNFLVDMSIPTTPAFAVLGATPEMILQPKSPRDLAVSLVQDLSDKSKVGKGVGFDIAPYALAYGPKTTLNEYLTKRNVQILSNTQLSFGVIEQDVANTSITRISGGLSFILFDKGDPRLSDSLKSCFQKAAKKELTIGASNTDAWVQETLNAQRDAPAGTQPEPTPLMTAATKRLSAAYGDCREKFKAASWNSSRWTVGLAQAVHNRGGGTHQGAAGLWTTYSVNLNGDDGANDLSALESGARSQGLFHYRHTNREEVDSTTDARGFELRRSNLLAIGFKYGSDKRNVSVEASVQRARFDTGAAETSRKLAIGGELMISKDLWLVMSIVGEGGRKNGNSTPFALAGLKFGSASESTGAFGKLGQ